MRCVGGERFGRGTRRGYMRSRLLLLAVVVSLVVVAPARAGTYDVYSCRLPDGSPAPAGGWAPVSSGPTSTGLSASTSDSCGAGGGLTASLPPWAPVGMEAGWRFTPPPATSIDAFEVFRAVRPVTGAAGPVSGYMASLGAWPPRDLDADADERCVNGVLPGVLACDKGLGTSGAPFDQLNRYGRRQLHATVLTLGLGCWDPFGLGEPACSGDPAADLGLTIFAARLTIRDDSSPTFEGDPVIGSSVRSVVRVAITAADVGAGLTSTSLVIDGVEVERRPLEDLPASCHEPFVNPAPCPARRELSVPFDSRVLADGRHAVQVAVFDAAGNRALSGPVSVLVANVGHVSSLVPGPNGSGATRFARLRAWLAGRSRKTERTLAYGATTSVDGQLTSSDRTPIAGATLQVEQRDIGVASSAKRVATVTTDTAGRFTYRVARGASRLLRFTYTAFPGDAGPVASGQVSVHVRAGVSLKANPGRVRNGTVLKFSGRVRGEQGTRRAVVTIYALTGGPRRRIPVETVRAAASGRFVYRYRFRSIPGPVVYRFEARVLQQTGFPYVDGASRPAAVHARPSGADRKTKGVSRG